MYLLQPPPDIPTQNFSNKILETHDKHQRYSDSHVPNRSVHSAQYSLLKTTHERILHSGFLGKLISKLFLSYGNGLKQDLVIHNVIIRDIP